MIQQVMCLVLIAVLLFELARNAVLGAIDLIIFSIFLEQFNEIETKILFQKPPQKPPGKDYKKLLHMEISLIAANVCGINPNHLLNGG